MSTKTPHTEVHALLRGIDEKFTLLLENAEKLNETRFLSSKEAVAFALTSSEKAILKAEAAADKRFESVNEFRAALSDQSNTFMTRTEYHTQHASLAEKVDRAIATLSATDKLVGELRERGACRNDVWAILVSVVGMGVSLATLAILLMRH